MVDLAGTDLARAAARRQFVTPEGMDNRSRFP